MTCHLGKRTEVLIYSAFLGQDENLPEVVDVTENDILSLRAQMAVFFIFPV